MKKKKDILQYLKENGDNIEIPDSILPQEIRKKLENSKKENMIKQEKDEKYEIPTSITPKEIRRKIENKKNSETEKKKNKKRALWESRKIQGVFATAACVCLLVGSIFISQGDRGIYTEHSATDIAGMAETKNSTTNVGNSVNSAKNRIGGGVSEENSVLVAEESELQTVSAYPEITYEDIYKSMFSNMQEKQKNVFEERELREDSAVSEKKAEVEEAAAYGTTNIQTVGVDEGDVVKNDGRFLYQIIYQEEDYVMTQALQIVDTQDGLKEVCRIKGFESIHEFYVWENTLVIIQNKHMAMIQNEEYAKEELVICGNQENYFQEYHEISFYNIEDRSVPEKIKTFTLKGRYDSSRITDGYFYGFSKFYATMGEGKEDYAAYIPQIDGTCLECNQIFLPKEMKGNCYLVMVSIDMKKPVDFTQTMAMVIDCDRYYVSNEHIYIAKNLYGENEEGWNSNQVSLYSFFYEKGKFELQAEGKVKGNLESSFSMDEYQGYLRLVTTVDEYEMERIRDDRTGEVLGTEETDRKRSNALYILNQGLEVIGKIENLAEEEQIYSARFMGKTGYFVTFRQTDPLFAVDLTDPRQPRVLSELKISGFSEYLHFYGEDRLLGIGMEADEETGSTQGMKLSMFDISNPENVQEISKKNLGEYYYSEGLYNHRAILISPGANIFGFEAEGHEQGEYRKDYLVFSYENEEFVQKLKVETNNRYGNIYSSRGTFINDIFYLLTRDGSVQSYDLHTGEKIEEL